MQQPAGAARRPLATNAHASANKAPTAPASAAGGGAGGTTSSAPPSSPMDWLGKMGQNLLFGGAGSKAPRDSAAKSKISSPLDDDDGLVGTSPKADNLREESVISTASAVTRKGALNLAEDGEEAHRPRHSNYGHARGRPTGIAPADDLYEGSSDGLGAAESSGDRYKKAHAHAARRAIRSPLDDDYGGDHDQAVVRARRSLPKGRDGQWEGNSSSGPRRRRVASPLDDDDDDYNNYDGYRDDDY